MKPFHRIIACSHSIIRIISHVSCFQTLNLLSSRSNSKATFLILIYGLSIFLSISTIIRMFLPADNHYLILKKSIGNLWYLRKTINMLFSISIRNTILTIRKYFSVRIFSAMKCWKTPKKWNKCFFKVFCDKINDNHEIQVLEVKQIN